MYLSIYTDVQEKNSSLKKRSRSLSLTGGSKMNEKMRLLNRYFYEEHKPTLQTEEGTEEVEKPVTKTRKKSECKGVMNWSLNKK